MMKFEYEKQPEAERKCVAFIDVDGDLMIRTQDDKCVWISKHGAVYEDYGRWDEELADHRFYPGDSITIKF